MTDGVWSGKVISLHSFAFRRRGLLEHEPVPITYPNLPACLAWLLFLRFCELRVLTFFSL